MDAATLILISFCSSISICGICIFSIYIHSNSNSNKNKNKNNKKIIPLIKNIKNVKNVNIEEQTMYRPQLDSNCKETTERQPTPV